MSIHDETRKKGNTITGRRKLRRIVTSLAVVVVFVTTYALILPAITLEDQAAEKMPGIDTEIKAEEPADSSGPVESGTESEKPASGKSIQDSADNADNDTGSAVGDAKSDDEIKLIDEKTKLTFDGKGYKVIAECGADSKLPADTKLKVKEIKDGTKDENGEKYDYDAYCKEALGAVRDKDGKEGKMQMRSVRLYDISFESASYEGEGGLEPAAPVKVRIVFDKAVETSDDAGARAVHFEYDEKKDRIMTDVLKTETETDSSKAMKEASFRSDSFSVYGVVYTVDFHWDVDGEQFEYSIPGGGFISFTELVDILGIGGQKDEENSDAQTDEFVAGVETIEFSSPELMDVSRADEDTTVGQIKESRGLECEYSSELTEEQIKEIDAKEVKAGDWALISLKPFDTEETLTVTMKNGEKFEIRVTDVAYQGEKVTDPNGKTVALLNLSNNNALMNSALSSVQGRLQAEDIQVTGNRISSYVALSTWTFTRVPNTTDQYYIQTSNGYLNISTNNPTGEADNGSIFISGQPQALTIQQRSDGAIRIKRPDNNYAVNNHNNRTSEGYGAYSSTWNANPGEWFTMYEIGEPIVPHVTVHYVDRDGNELTDVEYTGNNPLVTRNADGTFNIPYDWSGQPNQTSVDLRTQFSKEGWTYANTHLAGKDDAGKELTYDGYVIDSELIRSGSNLQFKSDSGSTWGFSPAGNLKYDSLSTFDLSQTVRVTPSVNGRRITYAESANKDIYVILDPPAEHSAGGGPGGSDLDIDDPTFKKEMEPNDDGTYTLSLEVKTHAKNEAETNKANVLFIVDTSSSMRATTTSGSRNRIMDTHDAVLEFGDKLLAYNDDHPGAVEVSMITFDGSVDERLDWTSDKAAFDTSVNEYLRYYYLHTGTDWEDGMKSGLDKILSDTDEDPTFVVFFTDGEPSQYTSFHGSGTNSNADPTGTHQGAVDSGTGYPDFFSYFLSREASKDEMRAVVNTGAKLYGIYAYNSTDEGYEGYNGKEDGALMLHNAIRYGYDTTSDLTNNKFFEAHNTSDVKKAFDEVFNSITETVGLSNLVVRDGIAAGVTSSAVVDGDVSAFTYIIKNKSGDVEYKVTVAPNGVTQSMGTVEGGTPIFTIGTGPPVVGEKKDITTKKIITDDDGRPILDDNNKIQTEDIEVEAYYYKDTAADREYIMPIASTGENVAWDLSPLGILKDGYTYEVNFVVWPNQESYDLVADLNNGKRTDLEEHWEDMPVLYDKDGKAYRKGGIAEYPFISRYDPTDDTPAIYSAMSNTEQTMDYYVIDRKSVEGEEVEVITGPFNDPIDPPDPMPLTATELQIEKVWNVDRNPAVLTELLYGNKDEHGNWIPFSIRFGVFQDDSTEEYTSSTLGWQEGWDKDTDDYEWLDAPEEYNVTYDGKDHKIGRRWAQDFAVATGLMLSTERMDALGLNKGSYDHFDYNGKTYYVLENGHDYRLEESPKMGYEFDYSAPVYHPMLVDGKLQSVTFSKNSEGEFTGITDMTNEQNGLSSLKVENTLRGYINLNKVVVDENNRPVPDDKTKFHYTVRMQNPAPVFDSDHIPWYGVNGLFYHDADFNYYQAYTDEQGNLKICTESGGLDHPYDASVVSGTFDPNNVTGQEITFDDGSGERTVTIMGNRTTASGDMKTAEAEMWINQDEILNIANVPLGTGYTITETQNAGYELKSIESNQTIEKDGYTVSGTIVQNADNNVTYTNKFIPGSLKITKVVEDHGSTPNTEHVDGSYIFKVASGEDISPSITKYVQITVENGAAVSYKVADTEADLETAESHTGSPAVITGLKHGDYTIEEVNKNGLMLAGIQRGDEDAEAVDEETNTVTVHVTAGDDDAAEPDAQAEFTNAYYENDGPDKTALDIVKTFSGISSLSEVPDGADGFEVVIRYTLGGEEKTITLEKESDETNSDGIKIKATADGLTIRWHITNIPDEATDFRIKEANYDSIPGYDLTTVTLNGSEITTTAGDDWHQFDIEAPTAGLTNVTSDRRQTDGSSDDLIFALEDDDIILLKLRGNQGTLAISKTSLNTVRRAAVIKGWPAQGGFDDDRIIWFSAEEHHEGFSFSGNTVRFSESDGKTIVDFISNSASHTYVYAIDYGQDANLNNASLTNEYDQNEVSLEIIKVEKDSDPETRIPGAQFTIRKIKSTLGAGDVQYDGDESVPVTTNEFGIATFADITQGYYEIRESKIPAGYVATGDRCFYIKVDDGVISMLEKDLSKNELKYWNETTSAGNVTFTAATVDSVATAKVENEPGADLPFTGGPGTTWMYIFGMLLTLAAGMTFTVRRRMRA